MGAVPYLPRDHEGGRAAETPETARKKARPTEWAPWSSHNRTTLRHGQVNMATRTTGPQKRCPDCGGQFFARTSADGANCLVDAGGRLHLCTRKKASVPSRKAPPAIPPKVPRRPPEKARNAVSHAKPAIPTRSVSVSSSKKDGRAGPVLRRVRAPVPVARIQPLKWDVLENRHVRCAECREPVRIGPRIRKEVTLLEVDGSATHICGRPASDVLRNARAVAREAVAETLRQLMIRDLERRRVAEQVVPREVAWPVSRPHRARRKTSGRPPLSASSRECPACGNLMAGAGDSMTCWHCGS